MVRSRRISALLSWAPVAVLLHECVVACHYDPVRGQFIAVEKLSRHLGVELQRGDVAAWYDDMAGRQRFGRVVARSGEWVDMEGQGGIRQISKGSICVLDDGRRNIVPEAVVVGRVLPGLADLFGW